MKKAVTIGMRVSRMERRQWKKAAYERGMTLTKLVKVLMDKELIGVPGEKLEPVPEHLRSSA